MTTFLTLLPTLALLTLGIHRLLTARAGDTRGVALAAGMIALGVVGCVLVGWPLVLRPMVL